jgi:hypothetical protein
MSYIPLTLAPDENVFIRDRFNLILAAFCVYANCTWFDVIFPNGVVASVYSRYVTVSALANVGFLNRVTYLVIDGDEFMIDDQVCHCVNESINLHSMMNRPTAEIALCDFYGELMEYVYDYYPDGEPGGYPDLV